MPKNSGAARINILKSPQYRDQAPTYPPSDLKPRQYTQLTGASGEFYVAAELSRRLWMASVTPHGVERTDVLAQHLETHKVVAIQVKTAGARNNFQLGKKLEQPTTATNEWVILVSLGAEGDRPTFYVVPRNVIAALIWVDHRRWVGKPGRSGRPHKDGDRRVVRPAYVDAYKERWDWLHRPTIRVTVQLPEWFNAERKHHGLPEGHPGVGRSGRSFGPGP